MTHDLEMRLRQQELLAQLGVHALQGKPFDVLIQETVRSAAAGLESELCKIMEYVPDENRLVVRAGIGWAAGVIGSATVGADLESPAGYALHTGQPVISNQLEDEQRFRTPDLLRRHGVRRAINVILRGEGKPYGVLEADSRSPGAFSKHDLSFLQGMANVLGMAIERQRMERDLKAALDLHKVLLDETNHRVKNSLQVVASVLGLQSGTSQGTELQERLRDASARVMAIAKAHESLFHSGDIRCVDLGSYLTDICRALAEQFVGFAFDVTAPGGLEIDADRAIPIALIVNEIATNVVKHAYRGLASGTIRVTLIRRPDGNRLILRLRDEGAGMPAGFEFASGRSLGSRIVFSLSQQLGAKLDVIRHDPGTEFVLDIPVKAPA